MNKLFKKAIIKITAPLYNKKYRRYNHQSDVTFISQNCVGGVIYHMLGLQFSSPTVNMFIEDENFVKLVENPHHYFSVDAKPYNDCYVDKVGDDELVYPVIQVDDIFLCCMHYENCQEAVEAWNKRRLRVNYDKIFVISCSWNLHEREDLVKRVIDVTYPKVIFTTEEFNYPQCVKLQGTVWKKDLRGAVKPNLTSFKGLNGKRYFTDEFDFVKWINT